MAQAGTLPYCFPPALYRSPTRSLGFVFVTAILVVGFWGVLFVPFEDSLIAGAERSRGDKLVPFLPPQPTIHVGKYGTSSVTVLGDESSGSSGSSDGGGIDGGIDGDGGEHVGNPEPLSVFGGTRGILGPKKGSDGAADGRRRREVGSNVVSCTGLMHLATTVTKNI